MAAQQYVHVGAQPIEVKGKTYEKGDEIMAEPEDMAFFLQINAVEEKNASSSPKGSTPVKAVVTPAEKSEE